MGKGGYAGGSTIIGPRRKWSDWREFPEPAQPVAPPPKLTEDQREAAERKAAQRRADNLAKQARDEAETRLPPPWPPQEAVLVTLGLHPLPSKAKDRGPILKGLVRSGVLLPTGRPNPDHSFVRAMIARKETTHRG